MSKDKASEPTPDPQAMLPEDSQRPNPIRKDVTCSQGGGKKTSSNKNIKTKK